METKKEMTSFWERISEEEKNVKDKLKKEMEAKVKRLMGFEIEIPRRAVSQFLFAKEPTVFKIEVFKIKKGKKNHIYIKKVKKFYERF